MTKNKRESEGEREIERESEKIWHLNCDRFYFRAFVERIVLNCERGWADEDTEIESKIPIDREHCVSFEMGLFLMSGGWICTVHAIRITYDWKQGEKNTLFDYPLCRMHLANSLFVLIFRPTFKQVYKKIETRTIITFSQIAAMIFPCALHHKHFVLPLQIIWIMWPLGHLLHQNSYFKFVHNWKKIKQKNETLHEYFDISILERCLKNSLTCTKYFNWVITHTAHHIISISTHLLRCTSF